MGTTTIKSSPGGRTDSNSSQEDIMKWDQKNNVVLVQTSYNIESHEREDDASIRAKEQDWNRVRVHR